MRNLGSYLLLFSFTLLLIGCECYPTRKGVILDQNTRLPIENAQIQFGSSQCLSDAQGHFEISANGCNLKLTVTKDGYKPFGARFSNNDNTISIEIDNEINYRDLEKPEYLNPDSTSFLKVRSTLMNSVHFEYLGETEGVKIYLNK